MCSTRVCVGSLPTVSKANPGSHINLGSESYNYYSKDWYHLPEVLKAPIWTDPYFDEGAGHIMMTTCSRPFFERGASSVAPKVRGIVTADVSLEWLTALVQKVEVGRTGYCFIISDTGHFVTHPNPEFVMSESMFSLAEELQDPALRTIGLTMAKEESGFTEIGPGSEWRGRFLGLCPNTVARLVVGRGVS